MEDEHAVVLTSPKKSQRQVSEQRTAYLETESRHMLSQNHLLFSEK